MQSARWQAGENRGLCQRGKQQEIDRKKPLEDEALEPLRERSSMTNFHGLISPER